MRLRDEAPVIDGLLLFDLDVHEDDRGWFKEVWQREKMRELGLPDFKPVQSNVSFNELAGTTRGMHAEPWDKLVSVATGRVFAAWIDMRADSPTFGVQMTAEIGAGSAAFVPRGVANGYQSLEDATTYIYLVNDHWSPSASYVLTNLNQIEWPLEPTMVSEKDKAHPPIDQSGSILPKKVLVTGADGQLGRALKRLKPAWDYRTKAEFDIADPPVLSWRQYQAIINCAAITDVDGSESNPGPTWSVNAAGVAQLAAIATTNNLTLVQLSSDYIQSGGSDLPLTESETTYAPLNVYGASKAAGELAARAHPESYVVRTSWVFGEGSNFVSTMMRLAEEGKEPRVVNDQLGRLTYAADLAEFICHLIETKPEYGVYNFSNAGPVSSWFEIACEIFKKMGHGNQPSPISTNEFTAGKLVAKRPRFSTFDLTKASKTGFDIRSWVEALDDFIDGGRW